MNKPMMAASLLGLLLITSGCIVRSLYPWLPDETRVTDISLAGTWHDGKEDQTAFFTSGSETNYSILLICNGKEESRFTASLHRLEKTLLLVVGPADRNDMSWVTTLPAQLLFKVELHENRMKLYELDLESFGDRVKQGKLSQLEEGNKNDGFILLSKTRDLTSFLESQLKDKTLFSEKPMYTFRKLEEE